MTIPNRRVIVSILLITYGIIKITISVIALVLPFQMRQYVTETVPMIKPFLPGDSSFPGLILDIVLFLFGAYSLVQGLVYLDIMPQSFAKFWSDPMLAYVFNNVLGLILVVMFTLILYTNIPIKKSEQQYYTYKMFGLIGGYMFLCSMPVIYLFRNGLKGPLSVNMIWLLMTLLVIITYNLSQEIHRVFDNLRKAEWLTLLSIPLNSAVLF
jgi:hypothetical protein